MARVTDKILHAKVDAINAHTKTEYGLSFAYGGVKLVRYYDGTSAIGDVTCGYTTRSAMADILDGIYTVLMIEESAKHDSI